MRIIFLTLSILFFQCAVAQKDTIVVVDYTTIMVDADNNGVLYPVTNLEEVFQAGFFINGVPDGEIRICPSEELFVWVNGRLLDVIETCSFYRPQELFENANSDTIFVLLKSKGLLADIKCEQVVFEELLVIKDQISVARNVRSELDEFIIIALLILVFALGIIVSTYPARITYLIEKSFTLKASAYEFINTGFFTGVSMNVLAFYSLSLAFIGVYLDAMLDYGLFGVSESLMDYIIGWLKVSIGIFLLFIIKWIVISVVAGLFRFRDLKNFQLFDFLNFNLVLLFPVLIFLIVDFVLNGTSQTWLSSGFMMLFPAMLILFVFWFTLKFVNNSPRKKLSIISYLCATEIIPVIILLGWFLK